MAAPALGKLLSLGEAQYQSTEGRQVGGSSQGGQNGVQRYFQLNSSVQTAQQLTDLEICDDSLQACIARPSKEGNPSRVYSDKIGVC